MILTAQQPGYLPWLGLFEKISRADTVVLLDTVQYSRNSFDNRNLVKTQDGPRWLTVPVLSKGHLEKRLYDIEINHQKAWVRKHLATVSAAYSKAPYWEEQQGWLPSILRAGPWHSLSRLTSYMLRIYLHHLGLKVRLLKASNYDFTGTKSDLLIDMCQQLGATKYVFGAQGRNYADRAAFDKAGIEVEFQAYQHPVYPQLHGGFVPNMSVLDLLFNCGPESLTILKGG